VTDVLLLIVGREKHEDGAPAFVIGALNEEYLAQLPLEDCDAQIRRIQETWTGDPSSYEWRTARLGVDQEELDELFETPEVNGYWQ
jgi:hypothetical protein